MNKNPQISIWARVFAVLMVLTLIAASLPQPVQAAPLALQCSEKYTVKKGDTLKEVAKEYGVSVSKLARWNDMETDDDIEAGDELCIPPDSTTSSNNSSSGKKATWTAYLSGKNVVIEAKDYSARTTFFVRVGETGARKGEWTRIGTLRVPKNNSIRSSFQLPSALRSADSITVCLKNIKSDAVSCKILKTNN